MLRKNNEVRYSLLNINLAEPFSWRTITISAIALHASFQISDLELSFCILQNRSHSESEVGLKGINYLHITKNYYIRIQYRQHPLDRTLVTAAPKSNEIR